MQSRDRPAFMIVCSCNVLSEGQVRACLGPGVDCPRTAAEVYQCLGCSPKCGRCARTIRGIVANALGESHACSAVCAAACPLAKSADAIHAHANHAHANHDHAHHDHAGRHAAAEAPRGSDVFAVA